MTVFIAQCMAASTTVSKNKNAFINLNKYSVITTGKNKDVN